MASISGTTSSLGNTSLRGYGGFASGIDRDSIIEQMTAGTTSKITNQKNKITSLGWKQESYQAVSNKILDLQDNYFSFSSGSNLKYPSMFAKNQITSMGDSDVTKFVSATGTSDMLDYLSILGVKQLATSSTLVSASKGTSAIDTAITEKSLTDDTYKSSALVGMQLRFGTYGTDNKYQSAGIFTFPSTYKDKDENGKDINVPIDYTADLDKVIDEPAVAKNGDPILDKDGNQIVFKTNGEKLAYQLNKALSQSNIKLGEESITDLTGFKYVKSVGPDGKSTSTMQLVEKKTTALRINSNSSALTALGYNSIGDNNTDKNVSKGITFDMFNENQNAFIETSVNKQNMVQYLTDKKLTISFGGQTKEVKLLKSQDIEAFKKNNNNKELSLDDLKSIMQKNLNQAFGTDNIEVAEGTRLDEDGVSFIALSFKLGKNASASQSLTITSDDAEIRQVLGLKKGASNKINLEGSIEDNLDKLLPAGADKDAFREELKKGLKINGVTIDGVTAETSIKEMMEKINANKDVGVKASYLAGSNQFVLVASETGSGREIELEGASAKIFGFNLLNVDNAKIKDILGGLPTEGFMINDEKIDVDENTTVKGLMDKINSNPTLKLKVSYDEKTNQFVWKSAGTENIVKPEFGGGATELFANRQEFGALQNGKNAQILVSYGNGINTTIESSSNTFDLEGLRVTVSSEFGGTKNADGTWVQDKSQAVTFSAKADVDGVTETVKKFIEEYNEMIKEINTQVTTRPDSAYGPLTEEQKKEMSETSIENWEKKAKQGLLYNDATMRALSVDIQGVMTSLLNSGVNYKDLEDMGITISDDYLDGGTITFDEAKFKAAMTSDPEEVANVFAGGGTVSKGLASIIEDTLTPYATKYATRNGNSYGRLIEEAGSEKVPLSVMNNQIYRQLKEMQEALETLQSRLKSEQDRYVSQFTTMETMINQMNSQASYLAQFQA